MRAPILLMISGLIALAALAACGKRSAMRPEPLIWPECELLSGSAESADTVTFALLDAVEPEHAPWARNASERLLFGQLYETLIYVDCRESVQPGLAGSWKSAQRGRRWMFELREDARFWDGTLLTAEDVKRSWQEQIINHTVIDSVAADGDRVLHVFFKQRQTEVPRLLSAPAFAIVKQTEASRWPMGSGTYQIDASTGRSPGISGRSITVRPAFDNKGPVITFRETSAYDTRDLLDNVIDVMLTTDPAVLEYAAGRSQLATVALPWNRTYLLLSTSRVEAIRRGTLPRDISSDLSAGLARDAVRSDARGSRSPFWWTNLSHCGTLSATIPGLPPFPRGDDASTGQYRVLYDLDDPTARDLAQRIVALAATDPTASPEAASIISAVPGLSSGPARLVAEGATTGELNSSLRRGSAFAYIISVPRRPSDPCDEARQLVDRAPWFAEIEISRAVIPLVDTRANAIVRRDQVELIADWYGDIFVVNVSN
jgi:hypothetical protein